MATSPLPRWAPTPSPSRPLCRSSDDGGRRGNIGDLLRSPFTAVVAALRGHHAATSGDDTAPSTDTAPPEQQHTAGGGELDGVDDGSGRRRERLDDGVFLTWEDVWVTAVDSRGKAATILNGVSGCARPGEVLAIMGPGGQQKRLSICLEILTRPRLLFLDEPTSGLDSAASFHVMSRITDLAAREGMTVIAVVHQPCREVFELFHGLCLLAAGSTIFFGPASTAAEFFASNGYPCPPMRNPSDHFLRTVNKDFDKESGEKLQYEPAVADEAIDILVNSYKSSDTSEVAKQEMRQINEMDRRMIGRNRAGFVTKTLPFMLPSLSLGTIFYNVGYGPDSARSRSSMLMFIGTLLTFMAIGGFPSFVEDMKIFGRERLNGHYGVVTFVISNTVSSTPYLLLIAVVPGAIAYYLTGLQKQIDHFIYFALVLCSCTMLVEGLMMIVATIVPDFLMGIITGAGIQGIMMLNSGSFQLPNNLPKIVWKYPIYYISFHKYALQGFYKNELSGLVLQNDLEGHKTITGEKVIVELFQVETGHSKWVDLAILCGMIVIYRLLFVVIIKVLDMAKPMLKGVTFRCYTKSVIHGLE
uniref:ABC transporter domain-containing protein n=1 Tax=Oryza glumipatula TaxID=40148 RepID=A0A0E0B050_9ORYZ